MYDEPAQASIVKGKKSWEKGILKEELQRVGERKKEFSTRCGIPVERLYTPLNLKGWSYIEKLGFPGEYPFTRGRNATMYRGKLWLISQYAGYGTAEATNKWYKYIIEQGAQALNMALDLPTQIGYDSDNPLSRGEVGKIGVAIDSLADTETAFDGIPLEDIVMGTTAMAVGPIFLAFFIALAEKRGVSPQKLKASINNDILQEYFARGTYIFQIRPALKFACDLVEYSLRNNLKKVQTAYNGYTIAEAGANSIQQMAFTLANAVEYIKELISRGISIDELPTPRVLLPGGIYFFEEICKHRAFRRMWARIMKERFNAKDSRAMTFIGQAGCPGSLFTAQQPLNNIARGAIVALVQALSGGEVLSGGRMDEALSIPSPEAVRVALRTQQIVACETGVADTVDPLGGSYYVEALTDEMEDQATKLFDKIEAMGGAVVAIERGFIEAEISKSAYNDLKQIESGEKVVVGLNKYQVDEPTPMKLMKVDPGEEERQIEKLKRLRRERNNAKVTTTLRELKGAAKEGVNLVEPILAAVKSYVTIGEICDVLRDVFGEYKRPRD